VVVRPLHLADSGECPLAGQDVAQSFGLLTQAAVDACPLQGGGHQAVAASGSDLDAPSSHLARIVVPGGWR
jgi:hypothetical protein